jgi:hypothetical protein
MASRSDCAFSFGGLDLDEDRMMLFRDRWGRYWVMTRHNERGGVWYHAACHPTDVMPSFRSISLQQMVEHQGWSRVA